MQTFSMCSCFEVVSNLHVYNYSVLSMFCLKVVILNDVGSLYEYVDKTQLTPCLGGSLNYNHQDWVQHRTVSCPSSHRTFAIAINYA